MLFHLRLTLCYMDTSKTWFKGPKRLNKKNILIKIWSRTKRTKFQNKNGFGHFENWTYCFVLYSLGNSEFFSRDYPTRNSILKRVLLKRSKNFRPSAICRPTLPFAVRLPSDRKKLLLTLPLSDVRLGGANTVGSILHNVYRIGPRSDVGQGQCQEKFFMVGRMGGRLTADKKRRKNFNLGSPSWNWDGRQVLVKKNFERSRVQIPVREGFS